jgi:hypothetical protein
MNQKQIICMWLGIAAFVLVGLDSASQKYIYWGGGFGSPQGGYLMLPRCFILWICVIVATSGLIYTFRDRKK